MSSDAGVETCLGYKPFAAERKEVAVSCRDGSIFYNVFCVGEGTLDLQNQGGVGGQGRLSSVLHQTKLQLTNFKAVLQIASSTDLPSSQRWQGSPAGLLSSSHQP